MPSQQPQEAPKLSEKAGVSKKKRIGNRKRRKIVANPVHIAQSANAMANRLRKQSQRWLEYQRDEPNSDGYTYAAVKQLQRYFSTNAGVELHPESERLLKQLEEERKSARRAAGVGEWDWVDDWFSLGGGKKAKEKPEKEAKEAKEEEMSEDGGVPVGYGRISLSPEVQEPVEEALRSHVARVANMHISSP